MCASLSLSRSRALALSLSARSTTEYSLGWLESGTECPKAFLTNRKLRPPDPSQNS